MKQFLEFPSSMNIENLNQGNLGSTLVSDFSEIMDRVQEEREQQRGIKIHIIAPLTGVYSSMSSNVDNIVTYIRESNIVKYKTNVEIVVHDSESNNNVFRSKALSLIQTGERYVVHIGTTEEAQIWTDITQNFDITDKKTPVMFSSTSTSEINNRTKTLVRLTANDVAMFEAFKLQLQGFSQDDGKNLVVYCEDNSFGSAIESCFEAEYENSHTVTFSDYNSTLVNEFNSDEHDVAIFVGNEDKTRQFYDNLPSGKKYFFYDSFHYFEPEVEKKDTYFFGYSGELLNTNRFRHSLVEEFNSNYGVNLHNYELCIIDIVNALSYITVAREQNVNGMLNIISSYGKYSGSLHFNLAGDRDNHYFTAQKHNHKLDRMHITDVVMINDCLAAQNFEKYSLTSSNLTNRALELTDEIKIEDLNDEAEGIEEFNVYAPDIEADEDEDEDDTVEVGFNYLKTIDLLGRSTLHANHNINTSEEDLQYGVELFVSETFYGENSQLIAHLAPSMSFSENGVRANLTTFDKADLSGEELLYIKWGLFRRISKAVKSSPVVRAAKSVVRKTVSTAAQVKSIVTKAGKNSLSVAKQMASGKISVKKGLTKIYSNISSASVSIVEKGRLYAKGLSKALEGVDFSKLNDLIGPVASFLDKLPFDLPISTGAITKLITKITNNIGSNNITTTAINIVTKILERLSSSKAMGVAINLLQKALELSSPVISKFIKILIPIVDRMKRLRGFVASFLEKAFGNSDLLSKLENKFDTVKEFFAKFNNPVVNKIMSWTSGKSSVVLNLIKPLLEKIIVHLKTAIKSFKGISENLAKIMVNFVKKLGSSSLGAQLITIIKTIMEKLKSLTFIKDFLTTKGDDDSSILSVLKGSLSSIFSALDFSVLSSTIPEFTLLFESVISVINDLVLSIPLLITAVKGIFGDLSSDVGAMLKNLLSGVNIDVFVNSIMDTLKEGLFEDLESILKPFQSFFVELWKTLEDNRIIEKVIGWVSSFVTNSNVKGAINTVISALWKSVGDKSVIDHINTFANAVCNKLKDTFAHLKSVVSEIITLVYSVVDMNQVNNIVSAVMTNLGSIIFNNKTVGKVEEVIIMVINVIPKQTIDVLVNVLQGFFTSVNITDFLPQLVPVFDKINDVSIEIASAIFISMSKSLEKGNLSYEQSEAIMKIIFIFMKISIGNYGRNVASLSRKLKALDAILNDAVKHIATISGESSLNSNLIAICDNISSVLQGKITSADSGEEVDLSDVEIENYNKTTWDNLISEMEIDSQQYKSAQATRNVFVAYVEELNTVSVAA